MDERSKKIADTVKDIIGDILKGFETKINKAIEGKHLTRLLKYLRCLMIWKILKKRKMIKCIVKNSPIYSIRI